MPFSLLDGSGRQVQGGLLQPSNDLVQFDVSDLPVGRYVRRLNVAGALRYATLSVLR